MHLLYLDESGSVADPLQTHFVLAGVAVFEKKTHWIEQNLNQIASRFDAQSPHAIELHGSPMRSGREGWKAFPLTDRLQAIKDALSVASAQTKSIRLFGVVVRKQALQGLDPVEYAFEQLSSRFDMFLKRLHHKHKDSQRGLTVFDKSSTEQRIQSLALEFKQVGHKWGTTKNFAEVPVFLDSKASCLIQLADLVAYALFRKFEHDDSQFYDLIQSAFDAEGGVVHGLHLKI